MNRYRIGTFYEVLLDMLERGGLERSGKGLEGPLYTRREI